MDLYQGKMHTYFVVYILNYALWEYSTYWHIVVIIIQMSSALIGILDKE